ncbi:MAG: hypothetical protein ACK4RK_15725 [Gemmataceae bacterium]
MMEPILCPRCKGSVLVPGESEQKLVCPSCKAQVTLLDESRTENRARMEVDTTESAADYQLRRKAERAVRGPAWGLMITGIVGLLFNICHLGRSLYTDRELVRVPLGVITGEYGLLVPPRTVSDKLLIGGFAAAHGGILLGGWRMWHLRGYLLAQLASWLAMLNFLMGWCLLGLIGYPCGAWAFLTLRKPEIRKGFALRRASGGE